MEIIITAVGPDHKGLADPIVHHVTEIGANISEIQMFDHREEAIFAMMLRMDWDIQSNDEAIEKLRGVMTQIAANKELSIRVWSPDERADKPNIAICVTHRLETPLAILHAIKSGELNANPAVMIGNRDTCKEIAVQNNINWHNIGDENGTADDEKMVELFDQYKVDYVALARYMRVLPAESCWKYAGGRIINLHHGLLPSFPGLKPYHDAYSVNMLTFGCTCHFIIPELDAGNQIINQSTFSVLPGTPLKKIIRIGQADNEPKCLVEGLRRVVNREVKLHFHRVVAT
jgi:formyltetrahydrofolate deformylase